MYVATDCASWLRSTDHPDDAWCHPVSAWLTNAEVQKLVVVISGVDSGDVLERWVFNVETDKSVKKDDPVYEWLRDDVGC